MELDDNDACDEYISEREKIPGVMQESFAFIEETALDIPKLFSKNAYNSS